MNGASRVDGAGGALSAADVKNERHANVSLLEYASEFFLKLVEPSDYDSECVRNR